MNEQIQSATPGGPDNLPKPRRRWFLLTAGALAAALTGAVATTALSEGGPPWVRGGMMGGPFHMGGPLSPAAAEDRADRMVRHLAIEIDATPEQQDKLRVDRQGRRQATSCRCATRRSRRASVPAAS